MDQKFFHSVRLDKEKCKGCTNCLKRCPTEAIRVRGGRAHIIDERCIDCGPMTVTMLIKNLLAAYDRQHKTE